MRISIENDKIVCSLEEKNEDFLYDCYYSFEGFLNGKLKMKEADRGNSWAYPEVPFEQDAERLDRIIKYALRHGVEVEDSVHARNAEWQEQVQANKEKRRKEAEEQARKEKWERLKARGCRGCECLCYDIDQPKCKATGEELSEKNGEEYDGEKNIHYFFSLRPFPSANCPCRQ